MWGVGIGVPLSQDWATDIASGVNQNAGKPIPTASVARVQYTWRSVLSHWQAAGLDFKITPSNDP